MIPSPGDGWARLNPRKLLLDPVKVVGQAIVPVVVALIGVSRSDNNYWPFVFPLLIVGPVLFGALPWLTTHYRLTDTQIQFRKGVLNKSTSTAPLDRVRSVDLEASLLHRLLGLQKVEIGTGVDDDRIVLDALAAADAQALRTTLLRRHEVPEPSADLAETGAGPQEADRAPAIDPRPVLLARIDWSWLRFAPFSLARLVLLAGAIGVLAQFGDDLPIWNQGTATSVWSWITGFAVVVVALVLLAGGLFTWVVVAVTGYVVQWWNFRLVREHDSLHLTTGLFTTRSITVEEAKVRGVEMTEPVLMRLVGGAELSTLATGVESGVTQVLPPCPRARSPSASARRCWSTPGRSPIRSCRTAPGRTGGRGSASSPRPSTCCSRQLLRPGGSTSRGAGSWPWPSPCSSWLRRSARRRTVTWATRSPPTTWSPAAGRWPGSVRCWRPTASSAGSSPSRGGSAGSGWPT